MGCRSKAALCQMVYGGAEKVVSVDSLQVLALALKGGEVAVGRVIV